LGNETQKFKSMRAAITGKIIWNEAMKAGLVLALVSITYMFLGIPIGKIGSGFLSTAIVTVLWIIKFILCIWLIGYFMKKMVADYDGVTNTHTFRYGVIIALLSALVYSAMVLVNAQFISNAQMMDQLNTTINSFSSMLDANSRQTIEEIKGNYVQILFFSNFIWCFIYGTILSFFLSNGIPSKDPFANEHHEDTKDNQ